MSEESQKQSPDQAPGKDKSDSFNVPIKKSPLFIYALLQIPLVIIMVVVLYFMYQARNG